MIAWNGRSPMAASAALILAAPVAVAVCAMVRVVAVKRLPGIEPSTAISISFMVMPAWRAVSVTTLLAAVAVTGRYSSVTGLTKALMAAARLVAVVAAASEGATVIETRRPAISMVARPPALASAPMVAVHAAAVPVAGMETM